MQEAGSTVKQISEKMSFSVSTISTILKDKEKYLNLINPVTMLINHKEKSFFYTDDFGFIFKTCAIYK